MTSSSRLLWRCRRGIREMDLLLQQFIETHYDNLSVEQKQTFDSLLDETDMDIMAWIMGKDTPESDEFTQIIQILREMNLKV